MELDNLGPVESFTLTMTGLPGGKFSVRSGTSQIETVILADQVLELRMRGELIRCLRKRKATDAYSLLEDLGRTARLADDIWCDTVTSPSVTTSREHMARLRRRRKLGQQIINGIRISDSEIEQLRNRGYEGDLVEAIETSLSDLLIWRRAMSRRGRPPPP